MKIKYTEFSEAGIRRDNQDYIHIVVDEAEDRYAFILCDGMGGHSHGGLAAKIIATSVALGLKENPPYKLEAIKENLSKASCKLDMMAATHGGIQMGTTLVMAYLMNGKLIVVHCGDSRCYVYDKDGNLKYQTSDHKNGDCLEAPLTRCFFSGKHEVAEADVKVIDVAEGDRIFLCSDGVYLSMAPDILRDRMLDDKPLDDIMDTFMFMCEKFSQDNYSAILISVE